MTDFAAARQHMVDGQVRTADVTDLRIISAMLEIPRERFVPPEAAGLAYLDLDLPLGGGRCLLKPMVLAKLIQAADIDPDEHVLDAGCATGYGAAVLAQVAGSVVALEAGQEARRAGERGARRPRQRHAGRRAARGRMGQGRPLRRNRTRGRDRGGAAGALRSLKDGGRLVCVLGRGPGAKAMIYRRSGDDFGGRPLFDAAAPLLPGFAKQPVFAF